MKTYLSYCLNGFLLFCLLLLSNINSYASHIVGLDLYYTYVTGSTYKITVVAFGDCGPASSAAFETLPVSSPTVCIYDGNTYVTSISLTIQPPDSGIEITPVCPGVITQCSNTSSAIPGIKKFVYSANYIVPHTSSVWRFVYTGDMGVSGSAAGRAAAITNILSGTTTELVDTLNNAIHHNSNPLLTVVPTPFFCLNHNDGYNPGAVDPDGDSLSFFLVPGINGSTTCTAGTPVTYIGTYSGAAPLGVAPGSFSLNPATGQILFFPNVAQRSLVVYNIEEYRNDTLIGTCQREMTFLVQTCTNPPPGGILSSATAGTIVDSTDFKICAGTGPFSIFMNPTEPDTFNNITVTASGLPAGATFTVVNNGTNHPNCTFSWTTAGLAPGSYVFYVTFTDNNCPINGSQTRSYIIKILPLPTIHASGATAICAGSSATLSATGGVSYTWAPGTGLSCTACTSTVASPAATTLYTLSGTGANGCNNSDTARIVVHPLPVISAGLPATICLGSSTTLSSTGGVSYVWSPGTGLSCPTCTSPVATPAVTTTYTVIGTDANGCHNTSSVAITLDNPTITAGPPATICLGGTSTLTSTGGVSYVWSPAAGLSCTTCVSPVASPTVTTTYTVTGTDGLGCHNTNTATITLDIPPIDAGAPAGLCPGVSTTLSPTGGVSYVWSPGTGLSCSSCTSPVANPSVTTVYTVTGTDAMGCHNTDTVRVTRLDSLIITVPSIAICPAIPGTLTATGGVTYTWSPATGLSCTNCASPSANPAVTTTYTIVGSNGTCTGSTTTVVTVKPLPTITASGAPVVCSGDSDPLTAAGGASYTWSPSAGLSCTLCATPIAIPAATTTYTVTGTGLDGCQNTSSLTVSVNSLPAIVAGPPVSLCVGDSTILSATGGVSYVWSPGTGLSCVICTNPMANPAATTEYTVTGTDVNGCHNVDSVRITRLAPIVTTATPISICTGSSGTLTGTGATSYTWSPGVGLSCTSCTSPSASPLVTTTYTIVGTTGTCTDTTTVTVTVNPLPVITAGGGTAECMGFPDALTAGGGATYSWSPATGLSCLTCPSPMALPGATTTYTVTGFSALGCSNTASTTVIINALPTITATPGTMCAGANVTLTAGGGASYSWSPSYGLSASTGSSVVASPTVTTTYTVSGTDANGCVNTITDPVTVNPIPPAPAVVSPVSYCEGATAIPLIATGTDLQWYTTPSESGSASTTAPTPLTTTIGSATWYVSQIVEGCQGPMSPITVNIVQNAITAFTFDVKYGCYFDTVTFTNNSQYATSYLWSFGDGSSDTTANPVHYYYGVTSPTTYVIKLDGYIPQCYSDSTIDTITLHPSPRPFVLSNITPDQTIQYGASVQLNVTGAYIYYWIPNDGTLSNPNINNPVATPTVDTTYKVYGMNKAGCLDSAQVRIDVISDQEWIPDAFTPNGDGLNDFFRVVNLKYGKLLDLRVYNRWGQCVCQTTNNEVGWDGKFQGVPQDMDVYNYMIIVAHLDGKTKMYKGNLTLIR